MPDAITDLPSQGEVEQALLNLLQTRNQPIRPADAYETLAKEFGLSDEMRQRTMENSARNHWENRVQWARNELVKAKVIASRPRGLWALIASQQSGEDWSEAEVRALVEDYFEMLTAEILHRQYSKTEHRDRLMTQIRRSYGSIERKHMNVSAILKEHGYPYIDGYKPYPNYERAMLPAIVLPHLVNLGDDLDRSLPAPVTELPRGAELFVSPPAEGVRIPSLSDPIARRFDVAERDARNRALGAAGEEFVIEIERQRLVDGGRSDLCGDVEHVSRTEGDGLGYDIRSRDLSGDIVFIEVKTTRSDEHAPFFLTENERRVAAQLGPAYKLYRVFNFGKEPRVFVLSGPLEGSVTLQPVSYRVGVLSVL
ncbi:MAG: DUF3883 domain-containing protein [Alphaproteobacteria bacterium]|nr:DUF3883 domain-containing protein [Alphaproteobacteria bacterium]MBU0831907.1 DUF3883 domain-containing protein [Alphaproteobacteria bacterium]MBU1763280.1 DUF3883 domain-containing protein [Alphaproteobacteria bacterium]